MGLSEALNQIARAGLAAHEPRKRFVQRTFDMGLGIDVTDVAEALDLLDGPGHR
jgi:DNA-binding GntR family transcriptional regulator